MEMMSIAEIMDEALRREDFNYMKNLGPLSIMADTIDDMTAILEHYKKRIEILESLLRENQRIRDDLSERVILLEKAVCWIFENVA